MRVYHLLPAVPALALVLMPFLPFVNTTGLWFGLPRMMVWGGAWCVLCTPAMLLTERLMRRREAGGPDGGRREAPADGEAGR